jgi:hypothetical protein
MTGDIREERKDDKNPNLEVVLSRELLGKQQPAPSYSQQELHVSPPVVPGSAEAQAMTVGSGEKLLESLPKSSRSGASLKMLEDCLVLKGGWFSRICYLNWKPLVTKQGRLLYQLVPKTPRTEGTGSGLSDGALIRTPSNQEPGITVDRLQTKDGEPAKIGERAYDKQTGRLAQVGLTQQIAMLPTPKSRDWKGETQRGPAAPGDGIQNTLSAASGQTKQDRGKNRGLKLQPGFALWMMGYPEDWCDLEGGE